MQVLAKEESRKLRSLREQVAAASRDFGISDAKASQARKQLAELQQAVNAAQHSMHSAYCTQPGTCSMHAPAGESSEQMTPTGRRLTLWHGDRISLDQSPEVNATSLEADYVTTQHGCVQPSAGINSHGGSPIRLTAGHWQFHPNSSSKDDMHSTQHAQHATAALHAREPALSALHGKLCSAEAEVARLRVQVQAQHNTRSRNVLQTPQTSPGEPVTPLKVGGQLRGDNFSATWAQERDNNPFNKNIPHGSVARTAAVSAPHAELASVSSQVAQQRSVLQHLTSQVLQVRIKYLRSQCISRLSQLMPWIPGSAPWELVIVLRCKCMKCGVQAQAELAGTDAAKEQLRNVRRHLALLESQLQLHASS